MESTTATKTKWTIDPSHTEFHFKARHLLISTVSGQFKKFDGSVETNGNDFESASIHVELDTDSVDTGAAQRDAHLKTDDFFNSEKYPKITFDSTAFTKNGDDTYDLEGNLTIRDITKNIKLKVEYGGTTDFYGNTKAGFEVTGKINRKEFGLKWDALTEAGGVALGEEIRINVNVQFIKGK